MPTEIYSDGSPRYDHGHDAVTGETWWARSDASDIEEGPWFAILMGREAFMSRSGRRFERWSFVTWVREGDVRQPLEVVGVTGMTGHRRSAWQQAVSESGYCRVRLEQWEGRLSVASVLPVWRVSDATVAAYAEALDVDCVDLFEVARSVFTDMLEGGGGGPHESSTADRTAPSDLS